MNYLLIPTLLIAALLFGAGVWSASRCPSGPRFYALCGLGAFLAIPGVGLAAYYLKIFGEPVFFYQFRSVAFSELTAGGAGLLAGILHGRFSDKKRFQQIAGRRLFPGILVIGLLVPYLKPIVRPPHWDQFQDKWSDDVCLQTSESSCGPACAATLLRRFGKTVTEEQIARESFTSRHGTENWYLARTLRKYGLDVGLIFEPDVKKQWPFPAIAGVRLPGSGNTGHFITVLDHIGDKYVIGDPLEGRITESQNELRERYDFTGFFMLVK